MGEIAFNSSARPGGWDYGNLYIGAGDYGSVALGEPEQLQRIDTPYGAILRIDPLGDSFERDGTRYPYGIPDDNPFVDEPGALAEVYAYGFRNAHRFSWGKRGKLYVSDMGQSNIEEVNLVEAGDNLGWPVREGTFALDVASNPGVVLPLPEIDDLPYRYPVAQYDHEEGRAIAGGFMYRGNAIPELRGKFVFGDLVNGRIFYAEKRDLWKADHDDPIATAPIYELRLLRDGTPTSLLRLVSAATGRVLLRTDLRFARDASGELLVTTKQDGFIRRLHRDRRPDCDDGYDDDGDGFRDYPEDPGCFDAASSRENPECQDGRNNDRRRGTDFDGGVSVLGDAKADPRGADPECDGKPWLDREKARRKCNGPRS
jgi:glucose/arabinose dehydrogenase